MTSGGARTHRRACIAWAPAELAPGDRLELPLPAPAPDEDEDFTTPYALVSLRWRPGVPGERDELDGWIIAGP